MKIRWHGHSCFEYSCNGVTLVVDPHDGRSLGIKPPTLSANVVLMTHDHYDHNASRIVKGDHSDFMMECGEFDAKGIKVHGYKTFHDYNGGSERGMNTIYKFEMGGFTFCHCGDLGCIPSQDIIDELHDIDFLFVPVGEVYTLDMPDVKKLLELVNPNIIVPMHYMVGGLSFRLSSLDNFLDMIPSGSIDFVGNEVDVNAGDLPDIKKCWVFDN